MREEVRNRIQLFVLNGFEKYANVYAFRKKYYCKCPVL